MGRIIFVVCVKCFHKTSKNSQGLHTLCVEAVYLKIRHVYFPTLGACDIKTSVCCSCFFLGRHSKQYRAECVQVCGPHNGGKGTDQESCQVPDQSTKGNVLYPSTAAVLVSTTLFSPLFCRCVRWCFAAGFITHLTHSFPTATPVSIFLCLSRFGFSLFSPAASLLRCTVSGRDD